MGFYELLKPQIAPKIDAMFKTLESCHRNLRLLKKRESDAVDEICRIERRKEKLTDSADESFTDQRAFEQFQGKLRKLDSQKQTLMAATEAISKRVIPKIEAEIATITKNIKTTLLVFATEHTKDCEWVMNDLLIQLIEVRDSWFGGLKKLHTDYGLIFQPGRMDSIGIYPKPVHARADELQIGGKRQFEHNEGAKIRKISAGADIPKAKEQIDAENENIIKVKRIASDFVRTHTEKVKQEQIETRAKALIETAVAEQLKAQAKAKKEQVGIKAQVAADVKTDAESVEKSEAQIVDDENTQKFSDNRRYIVKDGEELYSLTRDYTCLPDELADFIAGDFANPDNVTIEEVAIDAVLVEEETETVADVVEGDIETVPETVTENTQPVESLEAE